jgi:hypothetical protein
MSQDLVSEDIDFSSATKVISSAQKFIIPVPAFMSEGEPLVNPDGANAGKPIVDYQGNPIGDKGIVFFNGKDKSWQAASGDGKAVIIINGVTEEQGRKVKSKIDECSTDPASLTLPELKEVLRYVREDLGIVDMYNSEKSFIASKMNPLPASQTGIEAYGLYKRDDRDICQAVYVPGQGQFQGPAATPQKFENGAVIVRQGDSTRLVQPDAFEATYRHANGAPLKVGQLAQVKPFAADRASPKVQKAKGPGIGNISLNP